MEYKNPQIITNVEHSNKKYSKSILDDLHISKPIAIFLIKNGIDLDNIPEELYTPIKCDKTARRSDEDYTLTYGNLNYKNTEEVTISIKDIIGSFGLDKDYSFLECVSLFYNDKDEYGSRSLNALQNNIMDNVESILASSSPIKLVEIDGKYYVGQDGNHRAFYLMAAYYLLRQMNNGNMDVLNEIDGMFKIPSLVSKKSKYEAINKACFALSKCWNDDIRLDFEVDRDLIAVMSIKDEKIELKSESEFIDHFNEYLESLDKTSKKYRDLDSILSSINYFDLYSKKEVSSEILDLLIELDQDEVLDNSETQEERIKMGR